MESSLAFVEEEERQQHEHEEEEEEAEEEMVGVDLMKAPLQSRLLRSRSKRSSASSHENESTGGINGLMNARNDGGFVDDDDDEEEEEAKKNDEVEDKKEARKEEESFGVTNNNCESDSDIFLDAPKKKGTEPTNGFSEVEDVAVIEHLPTPKIGDEVVGLGKEDFVSISSSSNSTITRGLAEILMENDSSSLSCPPPEIASLEDGTEGEDHNVGERRHADTGMLMGPVEEVTIAELDVETIIQKQETHDLFCPNCNSCITKRVILRRRKRKIQEISTVGEVIEAEIINDPAIGTPVKDRDMVLQETSENGHSSTGMEDVDTGPDFFRCLSCFSIFVPTRYGFKFWRFGDRTVEENLQIPVQVSTKDATSVTAMSIPVESIKKGSGLKFWVFGGRVPDKHVDEHVQSSQVVSSTEATVSEPVMSVVDSATGQVAGVDQGKIATKDYVGESSGLPNLDELQPDLKAPASALASSDSPIKGTFSMPAVPQEPERETFSPLPTPKPPMLVMAIDDHEEGLKLPRKSIENSEVLNKPQFTVAKEMDMSSEDRGIGKDVVIQIPDSQVQPEGSATSPSADDVVTEETEPLLLADSATLEARHEDTQATGLDVLRAILYGGLVESITSLGVVTSAVGADSATLNVLVLGVANVIGGLFVLAHNLRLLRYETVARYEELLGRTGHFPFHASVALLSYLVFGLLPPILYGFSFRESDNRDLKLATVASSSLLCILLLSIGKAHFRSPPKQYIKTITYYVTLGILVSGGSFIFGDLLKLLMDKLGWFNSKDSLTTYVPDGGSAMAARTSS